MLDGSDDEVLHVLTGDAAGCGNEAHGLAIAAVQGKGDADALAVVAADLEPIGAPAAIAFVHRDAAIMSARLTGCMTLQEQAVLLHHPPDPFVVGGWEAVLLRSLASQDGMDAAIAIGRQIGDHRLDAREQIRIRLRRAAPAPRERGLQARDQVRTGDAERLGDGAHREPSGAGHGERSSNLFLGAACSRTSLRISASSVFLPSRRCNSRTCC